ncbi:hypothetical protein [Umezawaea sp.]|uniref:hypothetical protein n=1 Tax=Umezawaea sp. TaxID=1955258 RepID=UPI002ECFD671
MLSPKKACGTAITGLALVLVATACGAPDAAPRPSPSIPTISPAPTSAQASSPPVPSNDVIAVQPPVAPEPAPVEVEPTTEAPPPAPPPPAEPPPPPPPPPEEPADPEPPEEGLVVMQGTACPVEGAIAVNRRLKPMVCTAGSGDRLRWQPL